MLYLDYSRKPGEWVPNIFGGNENLEAIDFLKRLNELCHREHPGVLTIAEESTSWSGVSRPTYLGGLGFSLKWNMGWMNDTLRYLSKDPVYRKYEHGSLTFSMIYAFSENFILPLSHDEVVHGKGSLLDKMPGDLWQKFANLRLLYGYMYGHPGKKLLFMGSEIAQWREWNHDESLDWHLLQWRDHQGILQLVCDLNAPVSVAAGPPPGRLRVAGLRVARAARLGEQRDRVPAPGQEPGRLDRRGLQLHARSSASNYRIGVPTGGFYREILNTDSEIYGGSNVGNSGGVWAVPEPHAGRPFHLSLRLPPLGVLFLKTPSVVVREVDRLRGRTGPRPLAWSSTPSALTLPSKSSSGLRRPWASRPLDWTERLGRRSRRSPRPTWGISSSIDDIPGHMADRDDGCLLAGIELDHAARDGRIRGEERPPGRRAGAGPGRRRS